MKIKLTFLGTGTSQGVPVIACNCPACRSTDEYDKRLRASVLLEIGDIALVIDAGPDFRQQMLRANVKRLDGILLTHEHKDHVAGLDDVRAFNYITSEAVKIYAEKRVQETLRKEYSYAFEEEKYPGVPEFNLQTIDESPFKIAGIDIIPIRVMHYHLPILAYKIGNIAYVTDANFIEEKEKEKLRSLDILIINSVRFEKHLSHYSVPEVIKLVDELRPKKAYLTHLSHQIGLHRDIQEKLPANLSAAYDGLSLDIEC